MRILRVAQKIYPDLKGGAAYHAHAMSRDQAEMGHDVTVLTVRHDPELPHAEERDGYTIVRYDPTVTPIGNDISAGVAQYLRDAENFDVMHAHSHIYFSTNLAALKALVGDIPLAITNHGLYSQTAPERVFGWYLKTLGRWTFNQADVVFCYTDVDRKRLRDLGVTTRVEVVPNGIDTERFTPEGPESDLIDSEGPVVLFVGRLVEGKRPQIALEAVERVREEYPDVTLYFCGDGPLKKELKSNVNGKIGDSVVFLGYVPYDEIPDVYRSADVVILPSRAEGFPRTVLEAIESGTPVVRSDLEQLSTTLGDLEDTCNPEKPQAFANQIKSILTKEEYTGTSDHGDGTSHAWSDTVSTTTATIQNL